MSSRTTAATNSSDSKVSYPSSSRAVFTPTGPFTPHPRRLQPRVRRRTDHALCSYDVVLDGSKLTMTSVGSTFDETCTGTGQSKPIQYTYEKSH